MRNESRHEPSEWRRKSQVLARPLPVQLLTIFEFRKPADEFLPRGFQGGQMV